MAKIKVESQASGTGVYTLKTGTSSTSYTATLPDTTGTLVNTAPSTSGNVLTSDGTNWTSAAAAGGGKVLQVLQVENGTLGNTTSGTYQNTSIAVSITPSATTSKVLVFATVYTGVTRNDSQKYGATIRLIETVSSDVYPTGTDGNFGNNLITFHRCL